MDVISTAAAGGVVDRFARDGFAAVDRLVPTAEVDRLRDAYDAVLERTVAVDGDRFLGGVTRQVMNPSRDVPVFDENGALAAAREVAAALLGDDDVVRTFDMLIFKPPGHPHPTPWHQDLAYAGRPFAPAGATVAWQTLQFWIALDDVDVENGCMHFVPRSPDAPLLPHRIASGDPDDEGRLLEIVEPGAHLDLGGAVPCPLPAGGATVHGFGTPHFTPPNRSADRPRRAYIVNLARRRDAASMRSPYEP